MPLVRNKRTVTEIEFVVDTGQGRIIFNVWCNNCKRSSVRLVSSELRFL